MNTPLSALDDLKRYCVPIDALRTDCGAAGTIDVYLAVRVDDSRKAPPSSNEQCTHFAKVADGVVQVAEARAWECPWCKIESLQRALDQRNEQIIAGSVSETLAPQWSAVGNEPRDIPLLCYWPSLGRLGDGVIGVAVHSSIGDGWHRPELGSAELRFPTHWMHQPASPSKSNAPRVDCPHTECTRTPACGEHCQEPL